MIAQIAALIDLRGRTFPDAVAAWQRREGLPPDGVLGAPTWARMKPRLKPPAPPGARTIPRAAREFFVPRAAAALTSGQFGLAFDPFLAGASVPKDAIEAMAASPSFKKFAKVLDDRCVALADVASTEVVESGRIVKGRRAKRTVLDVAGHPTFSAYVPFGAIDSEVDQDRIVIHVNPGAPADHWVVQMALATARAHAWLTRRPRTPAPKSNIQMSVQLEGRSLREADAIVFQVFLSSRTFKGRKRPGGLEISTGLLQREFFPSEFRHSVLEHWVLSEFAAEDIARHKRGAAEIKTAKAEADAVRLEARGLDDYLFDPVLLAEDPKSGLFAPLSTDLAELRLILRVIDARWKHLGTNVGMGAMERLREEHQEAFFRGVVKYEPLARTPMP